MMYFTNNMCLPRHTIANWVYLLNISVECYYIKVLNIYCGIKNSDIARHCVSILHCVRPIIYK